MPLYVRRAVGTTLLVALATALSLVACGGGGSEEGRNAGGPEACADCHVEQVAAWESFSSHRALFDCGFCHAEREARPGPGHRSVPACADCHSESLHPAPGRDAASLGADGAVQNDGTRACARCHDPHGSTNLRLVRERIRVGPEEEAPIAFTSFLGRADASYAELSAADGGTNGQEAGSGLCEVCHASTRVYDSGGIGPAGRHPATRCTLCHDHASGFAADEVTLDVSDCGQGIPVGEQERVFEKFASMPRSPAGEPRADTGLGLPFCKLAVERMGVRTSFAITLSVPAATR